MIVLCNALIMKYKSIQILEGGVDVLEIKKQSCSVNVCQYIQKRTCC